MLLVNVKFKADLGVLSLFAFVIKDLFLDSIYVYAGMGPLFDGRFPTVFGPNS